MRKIMIAGTAAALVLSGSLLAMAEVKSLRGEIPLDALSKAPARARVMSKEGGFSRAWKTQPPLIPHKIDKERISLDENSCLRCHAPDTYKAENAPMISKTHFTDPEHPSDKNLMRRRWFCYQCHVPQVEAKPLVENVYGKK